jgi:hypothetical protein
MADLVLFEKIKMKVLILNDHTWALAQKKIKQELHCAQTEASVCRSVRKRENRRHWNEVWIRKRHIEALRLAKLLNQ